MKIVQQDFRENSSKSAQFFQNSIFKHWFSQLLLCAAIFIAGMLVYRAGVFRPIYAEAQNLLSGGEFSGDLPPAVNEVVESLVDESRLYVNNGLPTLYIDLPFESYQKLLAKRNEALELGVLVTSDGDLVPAQVQLQDGDKLDVKLRLKGDWTDHLQGEKWSYRIELKDDGQIFQMQEFAIQTPETRQFLSEWAFHQNLMQEGVMTTRYEFVNVLQNGEWLGIYALEESFAPELIESQGRRQGVLIRFDEDLMWENMANFWEIGVNIEGLFTATTEASADITPFKPSKISRDPVLSAQAETAIGMLRAFQLGEREASDIFDVDLMGRFYALSDLWAAGHGAAWHNMRFYFNPITGLLEPVAYDSEPFLSGDTRVTIIGDFIKTNLFNDPDIREAYVRELARVTTPEYIEAFQRDFVKQHDHLYTALRMEYETEEIGVPWESLIERSLSLSQEIHPSTPVKASYYLSDWEAGATESPVLSLELTNLMVLPVDLVKVEINGRIYSFASDARRLPMIRDPNEQVFTPSHFSIPVTGFEGFVETELEVFVFVKLPGVEEEIAVQAAGTKVPEPLMIGPIPEQPSLQEFLAQHPFVNSNDVDLNTLVVLPGDWSVRGDLILPDGKNLYISPGTTLRFEQDAILFTTGALNLYGTESQPVVLTAQDDEAGWGGVVVLKAENESNWKNAFVERMTGISRGGWILTGGITYYQSDIILDKCFIGNNRTEDAINLVHSIFAFKNTEFCNIFSDAFDSDFSDGKVENCHFCDVLGDAVDVSGSQVTVANTRMEKIVDKGISVGEESTVIVKNVVMNTVGIGIASKDLSRAYVSQTEISNARFAALAAYIKKPVFGPAYIEATDIIITDTATEAIAQANNVIMLRGKPVETTEFDVDLLYQEQILGN